jgi:simple sugar transport system permease protein
VTALRRLAPQIALPLISILLAFAVASVLIIFSGIVTTGSIQLTLPIVAYASLIEGALGGVRQISNTLVVAAPLILTGLAVGVGFKAGLFNIGASGQVYMGGFVAAIVGVMVAGLPVPVAITLAIAAGAIGGAAIGFIPGFLKAYTGAHEVVTTIMLNALVQLVLAGLVTDIFAFPEASFARTAEIGNAQLPIVIGETIHVGVFLAFACVPIAWWLLYRATIGFQIRTVGANPSAARYAGMNPRRIIILTMSLCGLFAGLAGATDILKLGYYPAIYGTSIGFDGITVALLGRANPVGMMFAALLLGGMRAGAPLMQINADVPVEIIDVIQALILIFIAADSVVRHIFRIRGGAAAAPTELSTVTRSYGEQAVR